MPNFDPYNFPHKMMRRVLFNTGNLTGTTDYTVASERQAAIEAVDQAIHVLRAHSDAEEAVIQPLLAPLPDIVNQFHKSHDELERETVKLEATLSELKAASAQDAPVVGKRLYQQFAIWAAHHLTHMAEEDASVQKIWDAVPQEVLMTIPPKVAARNSPEYMVETVRLLMPSLNASERVGWLTAVRAKQTPENFNKLLDAARGVLDEQQWKRLEDGLKATV